MLTALARLRTVYERARDIRTQCWEITGWEPCCCGRDDCDSPNGNGWPIRCDAPVSRLRWVLVGRCGQHGGTR